MSASEDHAVAEVGNVITVAAGALDARDVVGLRAAMVAALPDATPRRRTRSGASARETTTQAVHDLGVLGDRHRYRAIALLGGPGAGKGTLARRLQAACGMEHLDMGAMLRLRATRGDATGQRIHRTQVRGEMVPKELVLQVLNEHLARHRPERLLVLDGFPRTRAQLAATEDGRVPIDIDRAIWLDVPRDVAEARLRVRAGIEARNDDEASHLRFALMHETVDAVRRELVTRGLLEVVDATLDADAVFGEVSSLLAPLVAHS